MKESDFELLRIEFGRIRFFGHPEGVVKRAIADTIGFLMGDKDYEGEVKDNLDRIKKLKGEFMLFVGAFCPHCSKVLKDMIQVVTLNPALRLDVIDVSQFEELSKKYDIVSVPTLLINKRIKLTGALRVGEWLEIFERFEDEDLTFEYFLKMIREGRAAELPYTLMNTNPRGVISRLLKEDDVFVRVGVMYLLELVSKKSSDFDLADELINLLSEKDERLKEDVIMALGKIGGKKELKILEELSEKNENLKEAANDAIGEIKRRIKKQG